MNMKDKISVAVFAGMMFCGASRGISGGILDAAQKGDLDGVKQAIARGEDKDKTGPRPLLSFGQCGISKDGAHSCQEGDEWTPLIWASYNGHETVVRYLVEVGANPNATDASGSTAIMYAINNAGNTNIARLRMFRQSMKNRRPGQAPPPIDPSKMPNAVTGRFITSQ